MERRREESLKSQSMVWRKLLVWGRDQWTGGRVVGQGTVIWTRGCCSGMFENGWISRNDVTDRQTDIYIYIKIHERWWWCLMLEATDIQRKGVQLTYRPFKSCHSSWAYMFDSMIRKLSRFGSALVVPIRSDSARSTRQPNVLCDWTWQLQKQQQSTLSS